MTENYKVESAKAVSYKPDVNDMMGFVRQDGFFSFVLYGFGIVGVICAILAGTIYNSLNMTVYLWTVLFLYFVLIIGFYFSVEKVDKKEAIIKNSPEQKYLLNLGNEVKKFYGDAVKSAKAFGNQTRPVLVNAETVKRHFLCMATIGAGKSVLMKGLIEQYAILGGGCLIVDGKGTDEFAREIYGLVASVGREDDFVYLNFLDMNNTHTINPLLSGSALSIYEILTALLIGEENEWKAKQKEFMKTILKLMIYKRDNEPDFMFDFSALTEMMSLTTLIKNAIEYKHLAKKSNAIADFVKFVSSSIDKDYNDFLEGDPNDEKWVKEMMDGAKGEGQGVYDVSMSVGAWRSVITNLSSDYGRIFNTPTPNISFWEATQRNKIIFVTLPTMDSDTTPKELGRLILGLIKGVAAQKAKDAEEPSIPFCCFLDELGSYVVEGFGRLESKSRSLGISIFPFFQSPAQIDAVGKGDLERREIIDVTGVHILMKNMHPETTEFYAKFAAKINVLKKNYGERREHAKGQGNVEDSFQMEEKEAINHDEVVNMNNGEMCIFANGKLHRTVAKAETTLLTEGKKITYDGKIPLTQYVPKKEFFTRVEQLMRNKRLAANYNFLTKDDSQELELKMAS